MEGQSVKGFSVFYPNPVKDVLALRANSTIESIEIYTVLGQKVLTQPIDALRSEINVGNLQAGNYLLKVSVNGQTGTYSMVKR